MMVTYPIWYDWINPINCGLNANIFINNLLCICSADQKHEDSLTPDYVAPPAGQAVGSKCPFLAAEMVQNNTRVVRKASMELQEDVQGLHSVHTGKQSHSTPAIGYPYSKPYIIF